MTAWLIAWNYCSLVDFGVLKKHLEQFLLIYLVAGPSSFTNSVVGRITLCTKRAKQKQRRIVSAFIPSSYKQERVQIR